MASWKKTLPKVTIDPEDFGKNLKRILDERNITVTAVAKAIGVNPFSAYKWTNQHEMVKADSFVKILYLLDLKPEDLLPVREEI